MAYFISLCGKSEEKRKMQTERESSCSVWKYVVCLWQKVMYGDIIFLLDQLEFHKIQLAGRLLGTRSLGRNSYFCTAWDGWDTWSSWREEKDGEYEYWSRRAKQFDVMEDVSIEVGGQNTVWCTALQGETLHFVFCVTGHCCYLMDSSVGSTWVSALWAPHCFWSGVFS